MTASTGTYDNVITAGTSSVTVSGIGGAPTGYRVYDLHGTVIAEGSMSGTSVTISPAGGWPAGWFLATFTGAEWSGGTGFVEDAVQITSVRASSPLPPVPAVGTSPNAADPNGRGMDLYMHAFTGIGPERWEVHDAAHPDTYTAGSDQGGTTTAIGANLALNRGAAGYTNPAYADPARPRPEFITFPNETTTGSSQAAGIAALIAVLGPGTDADVHYFQGVNEPSNSGMTATQAATEYNAFRAAVKAANPAALAMGPTEVCYGPAGADGPFSPQIPAFETFLANITPGTLDVMDLHDYNAYNGDFLIFDTWLGAIRDKLAEHGYPADLPFWLTENSIGEAWNTYNLRRLATWTVLLYQTAERWGIPKEQICWFFDYNIGFDTIWLKDTTGDLRPYLTVMRAYSEEIFGKTYAGALDFGPIGEKFYRGNIYRGASGTCLAIYAQGNPTDTVTLALSDTGTITYSDWQGRTATADVDDHGLLTLPIGDLPVYIRLSASCTASVHDVGNGLIGATNAAPSATVTSSTGSAHPSYVNDQAYRTGGYCPGPDFVYTSSRLPDALTLTWTGAKTLRKVVIRQVAPWANYNGASAMVEGKLEYWTGNDWLPCPTKPTNHWDDHGNYANETAHSFLGQVGGLSHMLTWWDNQWCFNVDFTSTVVTTKLRWTVTKASYGDLPDTYAAAYAPFDFIHADIAKQHLMCSQILAIEGPVAVAGGGAFVI